MRWYYSLARPMPRDWPKIGMYIRHSRINVLYFSFIDGQPVDHKVTTITI